MTYDSISCIAAASTIILIPVIVYVRKIYKNYSSMWMLIALWLMAVDFLVITSLGMGDYFASDQAE